MRSARDHETALSPLSTRKASVSSADLLDESSHIRTRKPMELKITAKDGSKIEFIEGMPPTMEHLALPGVKTVSAIGTFGKLIWQQLEGGGFSITYSHYFCDHTVSLEASLDKPVLEFQLPLKNDIDFMRTGLGEVYMLEKQFNLFYTPFWETSCEMKEKNEYSVLVIQFSIEYLERLSPHFPFLEKFLEEVKKNNPVALSDVHIYANIKMMECTHDILYCDYGEEVKNLFVEAKVMELLIHAMDRVGNLRNSLSTRIVLRPYDVDRIREAAEILIQNMDNPITIVELAHRVGLNDFKLKKGFKQVYGTTIFNYFMNARMERAKSLLEETNIPIMDIAYMTGYRNISNFITAFRKNFGGSPGTLRKK